MVRIHIPQYSSRKPGGYLTITDPIAGLSEAETQMCCHCGLHWQIKPGSGIRRGFCRSCNALHCGADGCIECYPLERRLDDHEKGILKEMVW